MSYLKLIVEATLRMQTWSKVVLLGWLISGVLIAQNIPTLGWFYGFVFGFMWTSNIYFYGAREHIDVFLQLYKEHEKLKLENEELKTKLGEK